MNDIDMLLDQYMKELQWNPLELASLRRRAAKLRIDILTRLEDIKDDSLEHCEVCQNSEWADECWRSRTPK